MRAFFIKIFVKNERFFCKTTNREARFIEKYDYAIYHLSTKKIKHEEKSWDRSLNSIIFLIYSCSFNSSYQTFHLTNNLSHLIFESLFCLINYAIFQIVKKKLISRKQFSMSSNKINIKTCEILTSSLSFSKLTNFWSRFIDRVLLIVIFWLIE